MVIGLFIQVAWHWHWPKIWPIVSGVIQAAEERGHRVLIYSDPGAAPGASEQEYEKLARDYAYDNGVLDGMILTFPDQALRGYAEYLNRRGFPVITIGRRAGDAPRVLLNNFEVTREIVRRLVHRGHRRIAYLSGASDNLCSQDRLRGYRAGLADAGLPHIPELEFHQLWQARKLAIEEALEKHSQFTALIGFNDTVALDALEGLLARGVRVPHDVEVIGFDNLPRTNWSNPPLTTLDMQAFALGYTACEKLVERIRGGNPPLESVVSARLVPRGSTRDLSYRQEVDTLANLWSEGQLHTEVQLRRLRSSPEADRLLTTLSAAATAREFVDGFARLLHIAERRKVSVAVLSPLLNAAAARPQLGGQSGLLRAFDALADAAVNEQRKQSEIAVAFASISLPLRELRYDAMSESEVLECFRQVLAELEITRAALFLRREESAEPATGTLFTMNAGGVFLEQQVNGPDYTALLLQHADAPAFFVMPIHHRGRHFGHVLLDGASNYLLQFPDLVEQLSAALHSSRVQRALAKANRELMEASRMAGIAEMATGVLHNIGNALNSVNTSASVAAERLRVSKVGNVLLIADLLKQNRENLAEFLTNDPRGSLLLDYLRDLGSSLEEEREQGVGDLMALREKIEHLNEIVASQQSYANPIGIVEIATAEDLVDCAVRICADSVHAHGIRLLRKAVSVPPVQVPRQRVVQILVNLVNNARDALMVAAVEEKEITVEIGRGSAGQVQIRVRDNGIGIDGENLTKIFEFGFTTKEDGHGFGLHSSALAAREMGGVLEVSSAGKGQGATFVLDLPAAS